MDVEERLINLAKSNNGVITNDMLSNINLHRSHLKYWTDKGLFERSARGVYILPEMWDDEMFNFQVRYKRGIYALETALFLHDLTDRTPNDYEMFFPNTYNVMAPKADFIHAFNASGSYYTLGQMQIYTMHGNLITCYDKEKTLCDILRTRYRIERYVQLDAFKRYIASENRNLTKLIQYSDELKVSKQVHSILEVLL